MTNMGSLIDSSKKNIAEVIPRSNTIFVPIFSGEELMGYIKI